MMWTTLLLLFIVSVCVATDLYRRKIYNVIIFPGLLLAFMLHLIFDGWLGLGAAIVGFAAGLGILLIPYLLGGMGAGDVKLLALIGAIKGAPFVFYTGIYMALLGAVIAIAILLCQKGIGRRLKVSLYFLYGLRYGFKFPLHIQKHALSIAYPYGVAIAGGAVACLWLGSGGALS